MRAAPSTRHLGSLVLLAALQGLAPAAGAAAAPSASSATQARLAELLRRQDFRAAAPRIAPLLAKAAPSPAERGLVYQWLWMREDMAELDRRTRLAANDAPVDLQYAGRLALETRDFARAKQCFDTALQRANAAEGTAEDRAAALKGLGQLAYQQRDFDTSHQQLRASLAAAPTADGYQALADTLIRLGRTDAAIAAAEQAVKLNPYHEAAHYLLGNGYARQNYSQLAAADASAFQAAMALVRKASDAFAAGRFEAARDQAFAALRRLPTLGRAHAVLAKALESQRMLQSVHRAADERRFAALPMPQVPGIERYVLNWAELSPRHQKRVALSIAPWKAYIPLLVEGGATHYIKPLYMKLSDTPGAKALKDARIEYDSRLWDDVRGMGGHHTVTGIEDVERSIFERYNTVLHELSHQVHGVLTADQWREIQELYRRAKERDAASGNGFLSRYAGGSVWEYFAEGANALHSPRRDAYDPREMLLDRLSAIDPDLQALEVRLMAQTDVQASLPIALVNGARQQLEDGELAPALQRFDRALQVAPDDEVVLGSALYGISLKGERAPVEALARRALQRHPLSGGIKAAAAEALWHTGQPLAEVIAGLSQRRDELKGEDQFRVDLALADYQRKQGDVDAALASYARVLAYQADSPEGLWGRAATLALAERWDEAFAQYEKVLRLRTGLVPLRADYVRDLLRAGRAEAATAQLKEALLLDATDPNLRALDAWLSLQAKDAAGALRKTQAALDAFPWCDLALIVKARAQEALGRHDEAKTTLATLAQHQGPAYLFRADKSEWVSVHELPAVERMMLPN
jgi:tetratricopeptide (TPR) repeat protein